MNRILSIDLGVNCLASCFTFCKFPPILFRSQSLIQLQRGIQIALFHEQIEQMHVLIEERDKIILPTFENVSSHIVNLSASHKINKIIVGDGFMNHTSQHVFPFHQLFSQIEQKSRPFQITTLLVNEQYTSKVDALSQEEIGYKKKYSGVRRGNVYYRSNGEKIHADVNASINILRKHIETDQNKMAIQKYLRRTIFPMFIEV